MSFTRRSFPSKSREARKRELQFFGEALQKEAVSKLGVPCVRYRPSVPRSGDRVCAQVWAASCQVFYWDDRWVSQAEMYIPLWYLKCGFFQSRETVNLLPFLLHPWLKVISKFQVGPWCSSDGDRADKLTRVQYLYLQSSSPPVSWACPQRKDHWPRVSDFSLKFCVWCTTTYSLNQTKKINSVIIWGQDFTSFCA